MRQRVVTGIIALLALGACGYDVNLERGVNIKYLAGEFGEEPDAVVPIQLEGQSYGFRVWVGKNHTERITVQASPEAAPKLAGTVNKITFGYIDRPLDEAPFREAAIRHLSDIGKADCNFVRGLQSGLDRFSWTYNCATNAPAKPAAESRR